MNTFLRMTVLTLLGIQVVVFAVVYWMMSQGAAPMYWKGGGVKGGDLAQHYAAGQFWKEGRLEELYRGYHLGDYNNKWLGGLHSEYMSRHYDEEARDNPKLQELPPRPIQQNHFNYVYSPLVAWLCSLAADFDFLSWIRFWVGIIVFTYLVGMVLQQWKVTQHHQEFWEDPSLTIASTLAILAFPSSWYTIIAFQNTSLSLLIFVSASLLMNHRLPIIAGLVASCACYKPQYMPYLVLFMLMRWQWKFIIGLAAGGVFWGVAGFLAAGWEAHLFWLESLREMSAGTQFQRDGLNQSWAGFFHSLMPEVNRKALSMTAQAIGFVITAGCAWILFSKKAQNNENWKPGYEIHFAMTLWMLSSPYTTHYALLLGLPWWLICFHTPAEGLRRWLLNGLLILFWVISLVSIVGQSSQGLLKGMSFSAPFLTIWAVGSLWLLLQPSTQKEDTSS